MGVNLGYYLTYPGVCEAAKALLVYITLQQHSNFGFARKRL